jgi:hypothetical protein
VLLFQDDLQVNDLMLLFQDEPVSTFLELLF